MIGTILAHALTAVVFFTFGLMIMGACSARRDGAPRAVGDLSAAERSVLAERRRQISAEGWSLEHDDTHTDGEIARSAAAYAFAGSLSDWWRANLFPSSFGCLIREIWPDTWDRSWFKPKSRREDLVRAGALVIAEIERIDRLSGGA